MILGFITVDYDEPDSSTYRGLKLSLDKVDHNFNSGNLAKDYNDLMKFLGTLSDEEFPAMLTFSSSYDHFWMDGGADKYKEMYVNKDFRLNELPLNDNEYLFRIIVENSTLPLSNFNEFKQLYSHEV